MEPVIPTAPAPGAPPAGATAIALLHTANVRGQIERLGRPPHTLGGLDRLVGLHADLRRRGLATVAVDAGDLLLPAPGEVRFLDGEQNERERRAGVMLAAAARLELAAAVPGETDLSLGARRLRELARKAKVPFVCANLMDGAASLFEPARTVRVAGVDVGFFGLLSPPAADRAALEKQGLTLAPLEERARAAVAELRGKRAALVVGLFHLDGGAQQAAAVARAVPGIDVIVMGHGDTATERPLAQGDTRLVEAGRYGKRVGQLDIFVTPSGVNVGEHRLHALDHTVASDTRMQTAVARHVRGTNERAGRGAITTVDPRFGNAYAPPAHTRAPGEPPPLVETWKYGSSGACGSCHREEMEQWKTTSHAVTMESLSGARRQSDPECLQCHSTAFLRPGGTRSLATARTYFPDVGCESCHGPSAPHMTTRDKKTGTRLLADEAECRFCHGTDRAEAVFDVAAQLRQVLGPGHGM